MRQSRKSRRSRLSNVVRRELGLTHELVPDVFVDFNDPEELTEFIFLYWRKWLTPPYDFRVEGIEESEDTYDAIVNCIGIGTGENRLIAAEGALGKTIVLNFSSYIYPACSDFDNLIWRYMTEVDSMWNETNHRALQRVHNLVQNYVPLARAATERMIELRETNSLFPISKNKILELLLSGLYSIPELNGNDLFLAQAIQANDSSLVANQLTRCLEQYRLAIHQNVFLTQERAVDIWIQCSQLAFRCATVQTPPIVFSQFLRNPNYAASWIGDCLQFHVTHSV